jgi:hypothetical protein
MNLVNDPDDVKVESKPAGAPLAQRPGVGGDPERLGGGEDGWAAF